LIVFDLGHRLDLPLAASHRHGIALSDAASSA
jgi:hypothetical protein